jgi:2-methylisocitrate lyase-like PEP mutase family enzyme
MLLEQYRDMNEPGLQHCISKIKVFPPPREKKLIVVSPKRCGHLLGKTVTSPEEYASRIGAACAAKSNLPSTPLIIARYSPPPPEPRPLPTNSSTDAIQPHGIDDALSRMKLAHSVGAEVAFVEGILTAADAKKVVQSLHPMPCLLNLATNGNTPNWTAKEAHEMGFRIVIFPCAGMVPVVHALRESYKEVMERGTDVKACRGMGPRGFFEVVGLKEAMEIDAKAGGVAYKNV